MIERLYAAVLALALAFGAVGTARAADAANTSSSAGSVAPAETNFMLHCQGCHLPQGMGVAGAVPRMYGYVGNFLQVPGGRDFLVRVPGSANSALDDGALAELLNWVLVSLSPAQLPDGWRPYTAAEVARLRALPPMENLPAERARLVALIEAG